MLPDHLCKLRRIVKAQGMEHLHTKIRACLIFSAANLDIIRKWQDTRATPKRFWIRQARCQ